MAAVRQDEEDLPGSSRQQVVQEEQEEAQEGGALAQGLNRVTGQMAQGTGKGEGDAHHKVSRDKTDKLCAGGDAG